jgi:hypothetical protein
MGESIKPSENWVSFTDRAQRVILTFNINMHFICDCFVLDSENKPQEHKSIPVWIRDENVFVAITHV